jgi:hypothetical protein
MNKPRRWFKDPAYPASLTKKKKNCILGEMTRQEKRKGSEFVRGGKL